MEGDSYSGLGNNNMQMDDKFLQTFVQAQNLLDQKRPFINESFVQAQNILDQNRLLINEINQNHESKIPNNLTRNVGLIRELNNNIRKVVDLYANLSTSFSKSMVASSEGDSRSDGKATTTTNKRTRPV